MDWNPYAGIGQRERRWVFGLFALLAASIIFWRTGYIPSTIPLAIGVVLGLVNYHFTRRRAEESILED